jgi:NAD(P)-dependent dehydrogenase (short-subunit alcohol dehydrogenase family)
MGHRVIGADLAGVDIHADLGTVRGRNALAAALEQAAETPIDGIVAAAGIGWAEDAAEIVSVNYFGALAAVESVKPLMKEADHPNAVVVASTAALLDTSPTIIAACLAGDEEAARNAAREQPMHAYSSSKAALALWVRREAVLPDWAGDGVCLNAVAPGGVLTPMTAPFFATGEGRETMARTTPRATRAYAQPLALAEILAMLVTLEGGYVVGQILFVDGGTDAILRPHIL